MPATPQAEPTDFNKGIPPMAASPRAARQFTGATVAVARYGNHIWCAITDAFRGDQPFTVMDAVERLALPFGRATARQYVRATLMTVEDQDPAETPPQVRRVTGRHYVLPSIADPD